MSFLPDLLFAESVNILGICVEVKNKLKSSIPLLIPPNFV